MPLKKILTIFLAIFFILPNLKVYGEVCVGLDQVAALVSAGSNTAKENQNKQAQPSLRNPPVMRAQPAQRVYVQDGVYLPDQTQAQHQSAYEASRAGLDQQPLAQNGGAQTSSGGGVWGTLGRMIPSGGGGKCRGICY